MIVNLHERDRESLRDLVAQAEIFATQALMKVGHVPPTLLIQTSEGREMFSPQTLSDERSKEHFAATAKLMCIAHRATAAVFVAEGWTRFAKDGEALDLTKMPSQCADRQEVLMLMGEAWQATSQKLLPIMRSASGKFVGLGEAHKLDADTVKGRFAQFLPEKFPSLEDQEEAKELLNKVVKEVRRERGQERGHARF